MLRDVEDLSPIVSLTQAVDRPPSPSYNDALDDVFGASDGDGNGNSELTENARLRSTHVTNGYRDGIAESKSLHVQAGFDEGYPLGAVLGYRTAWLLNVLDIMVSLIDQNRRTETAERIERVERLAADARLDLTMERLFSSDYFDGDGVWTYDVDGESAATCDFGRVGDCHPLIVKWKVAVEGLALPLGLRLDDIQRPSNQVPGG